MKFGHYLAILDNWDIVEQFEYYWGQNAQMIKVRVQTIQLFNGILQNIPTYEWIVSNK